MKSSRMKTKMAWPYSEEFDWKVDNFSSTSVEYFMYREIRYITIWVSVDLTEHW